MISQTVMDSKIIDKNNFYDLVQIGSRPWSVHQNYKSQISFFIFYIAKWDHFLQELKYFVIPNLLIGTLKWI